MAGHTQVAQLLLLHGADVQAKDEDVCIFCSVKHTVATSVAFKFGMRPSALFDALAFELTQAWRPYYIMHDLHVRMTV